MTHTSPESRKSNADFSPEDLTPSGEVPALELEPQSKTAEFLDNIATRAERLYEDAFGGIVEFSRPNKISARFGRSRTLTFTLGGGEQPLYGGKENVQPGDTQMVSVTVQYRPTKEGPQIESVRRTSRPADINEPSRIRGQETSVEVIYAEGRTASDVVITNKQVSLNKGRDTYDKRIVQQDIQTHQQTINLKDQTISTQHSETSEHLTAKSLREKGHISTLLDERIGHVGDISADEPNSWHVNRMKFNVLTPLSEQITGRKFGHLSYRNKTIEVSSDSQKSESSVQELTDVATSNEPRGRQLIEEALEPLELKNPYLITKYDRPNQINTSALLNSLGVKSPKEESPLKEEELLMGIPGQEAEKRQSSPMLPELQRNEQDSPELYSEAELQKSGEFVLDIESWANSLADNISKHIMEHAPEEEQYGNNQPRKLTYSQQGEVFLEGHGTTTATEVVEVAYLATENGPQIQSIHQTILPEAKHAKAQLMEFYSESNSRWSYGGDRISTSVAYSSVGPEKIETKREYASLQYVIDEQSRAIEYDIRQYSGTTKASLDIINNEFRLNSREGETTRWVVNQKHSARLYDTLHERSSGSIDPFQNIKKQIPRYIRRSPYSGVQSKPRESISSILEIANSESAKDAKNTLLPPTVINAKLIT